MSEPDPVGRDTLQFCLNLNRATAVLTRHIDHRLSALHGLSLNDFTVLYFVAQVPQGKVRRSDLATQLGLTASGVTRLLLPLEKIGLITRLPDIRDARISYVALTPTGSELLSHALSSAAHISEDLIGHVPATQLRALSALLDSLK
ncbi:MarR family winged helix-turn-helix transcriptional regulator [Deinococcus sp. QL22]|uniref:MarR family winged helix-turn-helix transcriptional regulator n=1 Tax=Deinococcus sp. QL22 TaxID=2939437 RepID=UPI0020174CAF|nr:MarR family winged helix-turn-helix transcriptional regulator [Deinococcus sp. QL22]UQN09497.1 MarR family winged helix-turn-helix transcriptional regulator [Deinococcus sp. QL22]